MQERNAFKIKINKMKISLQSFIEIYDIISQDVHFCKVLFFYRQVNYSSFLLHPVFNTFNNFINYFVKKQCAPSRLIIQFSCITQGSGQAVTTLTEERSERVTFKKEMN